MSEIIRFPNAEAVAEEAARRWIEIAKKAIVERGVFRIALSGGNTPRSLYQLMASDPWRDEAPWADTHVFWGDERRVAASHPNSNYHMARELLLDHVPIPTDQVYRMEGVGLGSSAMRDYEAKLRRHFQVGRGEWPRFDLMLLGMGADGHIASIFPGTRAASDLSNMVLVFEVPRLGVERMTLTLPVFNHAHHVLFLVVGEDKAEVLAATLEGPRKPSTYPAQALELADGTLTWLVDEGAASRLSG